MNYSNIKFSDIANGVGVRTTLFVSGCRLHCEGCFNYEAWDFKSGGEFTPEVEQEIIDSLAPVYINGLSILGGEPFEPENQEGLVEFVEKVRATYPQKEHLDVFRTHLGSADRGKVAHRVTLTAFCLVLMYWWTVHGFRVSTILPYVLEAPPTSVLLMFLKRLLQERLHFGPMGL